MFYGDNGLPDPNGRFELIDGRLKLRERGTLKAGESLAFDVMFMDATPSIDRKAEEPATIDEALRLRFAEMAKEQGTTVRKMLSSMEQSKIEEAAAEVAKAFISARAGAGVAAQLGDAAVLSDGEKSYATTRARQLHDTRYAHLPVAQRPPFTEALAAAAVSDAAALKLRNLATQAAFAADEYNDPSFRSSIDLALRVTRKHITRDAWRRS